MGNIPFHNNRQTSSLFQDLEMDTGSRVLCKKVHPISEMQQQPQQLQSANQYGEGHIPPKLHLETKETLISFQNALQVKKTLALSKTNGRTEFLFVKNLVGSFVLFVLEKV